MDATDSDRDVPCAGEEFALDPTGGHVMTGGKSRYAIMAVTVAKDRSNRFAIVATPEEVLETARGWRLDGSTEPIYSWRLHTDDIAHHSVDV